MLAVVQYLCTKMDVRWTRDDILLTVFLIVLCVENNAVFGQDDCTTPSNKRGLCIPISECSKLKAILKQSTRTASDNKLLRDSQCGDVTVNKKKQPKVCCEEECGVDVSGDRIIGGEEARLDQFPWMALIEYRTKKNIIALSCGATLVNDRHAITAAHCVYPEYVKLIGKPESVRLGEFNKRTDVDCVEISGGGEDCNEEPVIISIENIITHPQYNPAVGQMNDIAILRLAQKAPVTDFIRPICLPRSDETVSNTNLTLNVAGWGLTEAGKTSDVKLFVTMKSVPIDECQRAYGSTLTETLSNNQICAGGERGKDSCKGDSGGPLMAETNLVWILHGVVSFGPTPCATPYIPGVYTKVFPYIPWIKASMKP